MSVFIFHSSLFLFAVLTHQMWVGGLPDACVWSEGSETARGAWQGAWRQVSAAGVVAAPAWGAA